MSTIKERMSLLFWSAAVIAAIAFLLAKAAAQTSYQSTAAAWREKREVELKSDDGWLTVSGLFWLKEGTNIIGTDPSNAIVLPASAAPSRVGAIEFHKGKALLLVAEGVKVAVNNRPIVKTQLKVEAKGKPDIVTVGDEVSFFIIKRGERYGVRVRNKKSRERLEFTGLRWFPVNESYRITARYVAYEKPKPIEIANILGDVDKLDSPGYVIFEWQGKEQRLEPLLDDNQLFFIFRDLTSGKTTYPAGRFLYTELPKGDKVILDFNQAINPPCAFTAFATCPLPPPQNYLKVAIEAGELAYHSKD